MSYQIVTDATADMDWSLWNVCVSPMEVRVTAFQMKSILEINLEEPLQIV